MSFLNVKQRYLKRASLVRAAARTTANIFFSECQLRLPLAFCVIAGSGRWSHFEASFSFNLFDLVLYILTHMRREYSS